MYNLINQLPVEELGLFNELRCAFLDEDSSIVPEEMASPEEILKEWETQKQFLYKVLGNQFTYSFPVRVHCSEEELYGKIYAAFIWNDDYKQVCYLLRQALAKENDIYKTYLISDTVSSCIAFAFSELVSISSFAGNEVSIYGTFECVLGGRNFTVPKGAKPIRMLSRMVQRVKDDYPALGDAFERMRLLHSQIWNDAYIDGEVVLSILPTDFLTASYNDCDWDSCMNIEGGDYRRGVIEMMNSPRVIEAYIPSKHMSNFKKIPFSNKKWREFFIVDDNGIFAIKGYPYWNTDLEKVILMKLKELVSNVIDWKWESEEPMSWTMSNYGALKSEDSKWEYRISCGPAMYNDFRGGNKYQGFSSIKDSDKVDKISINYSGLSECLYCGEPVDIDMETWNICCSKCMAGYFCDICGNKFHSWDDLIFINDIAYCEGCYSERIRTCPICNVNEDIILEDWKTIVIAPNHNKAWGKVEELPRVVQCRTCSEKIVDNWRCFSQWDVSITPPGIIATPEDISSFGFKNIPELGNYETLAKKVNKYLTIEEDEIAS